VCVEGKKKCVAMSKQILKVLIDLLGQDSDEVFTSIWLQISLCFLYELMRTGLYSPVFCL